MAIELQLRRGTTAENNAFTGAVGELTVDTTAKTLRLHDGSTAGGTVIATTSTSQTLSNKTIGSDLLPSADSAYDLGSPSAKWKDLYLSGNSLYLGDAQITASGTAVVLPAGSTVGSGAVLDSAAANSLITTAINNLIDGAPGALDTLNELAAALGDDANFASTITAQLSALPDSAQVRGLFTGGTGINYDNVTGTVSIVDSEINHNLLSNVLANEHINHSLVSITAGSGLTGGGDITASRTLNIGEGTGITVSADAISTNDGEIVHDNLSGFVANEHVDHSSVSITAGAGLTGGGDLTSTRTINVVGGGGINVNADNITVDSAEIRALVSAGTGISYNNTTGVITSNDGQIVHDNLSGFVANEHIDHTAVSITAGSGLTGGGTIAASRTLNIGQGTGITVSADAISTNDAEIVHDNLSGFVANEHIDHSTVSITAGAGLTGGGTIAASRTLNIGAGTGVTVNADNIAIGQPVDSAANVIFNSLETTDGLIVGGNLQVNGTTTTVNTQNLSVSDNMIYLNDGESAGSPTAQIDIGWAGNYNDNGSYAHAGMFRDATDDTFKVFENYTPEPDSALEINTGHVSFSLAPFAARTLTGKYLGADSDIDARLSGGTGITYSSGVITNSAPDQTVVLTEGSNVTITGTYPNFTIASTDTNTTYSAGTALDLSGTTFNVDLSELSTSVTDGDGDFFVVVDAANAQYKLTKGNINISGFNNDAGYTTNVGDITGVTAGTGLNGGGASGSVTLNVDADQRGVITQIGQDTSDYIVVGTTTIDFYLDGANDMRLENDGDLHVEGDVIAYSTTISDPRLKTDVQRIEGALDKVNKLSGYTFTYTTDGKASAGVLSTEVAEVLPSAIKKSKLPLKTDGDVEYDTVQYDQLHGLLIEAIKELKAEIEELKKNK